MKYSNSSHTLRFFSRAVAVLVLGSLPFVACGDARSSDITGETHFLTPCDSDADCSAISPTHRCEGGYCRADTSGAGSGGAGGETGCTGEPTPGNEVVVLGDTAMALTHEVTSALEDLARAAGALGADEHYRDESTATNNALALGGNGILDQYVAAAGQAPVSVVVMNGGGADVLGGACEDPPSDACEVLAAAALGARDFFARAAEDGVSDIVYAFYPNPMDDALRAKMDVLRPLVQAACAASEVPCHFVDLRPVFEGNYDTYITTAGINPTTAGANATANALWATMQASCIAQ